MITDLLALFFLNPYYLTLTAGSIIAAMFVLLASRNKSLSVAKRVFLIYAHIALLIVPLAFFAYSSGCAIPVYDCNMKTLVYSLPFILGGIVAVSVAVGYFGLPQLYRRRFGAKPLADKKLESLAADIARKHGIQKPTLWALDTATPTAFSISSFRPAIFISIGMLDILSAKELESVLLHEIGHLKHNSPLMKFSTKLVKAVSPIAMFVPLQSNLSHEECVADAFAIKTQGTRKFVNSARRKVNEFYTNV